VQVSGRVLHLGDSIPPFPHTQKRFLRNVFCFGPVSGDREQDTMKTNPFRLEELLEGLRRLRTRMPARDWVIT